MVDVKNRRERRKAKAKDKQETEEDHGIVTLHNDPSQVPKEHIAMLLLTLAHAFALAKNTPQFTFPIHIQISFDGQQLCGTIEPSTTASGQKLIQEFSSRTSRVLSSNQTGDTCQIIHEDGKVH